MVIRPAKISDSSGIAMVNVDAWKSTYKGIISDEYLDNLSYEKREQAIRQIINTADDKKFIFVAENIDGRIIGFASFGKYRENDNDINGELYAIYILKEFQGKGTGKLLYRCAMQKLKESSLFPVIIWVLDENSQARKFYESMGAAKVKERFIHIGNQEIKELAYIVI